MCRTFFWEKILKIKTCFHLEHPDLPQCDLFDDGIVLRLHKLLDGDDLPRVFVSALEDDAVGALSDLSDLLVLLHPSGILGHRTLFPRRQDGLCCSLKRDTGEDLSHFHKQFTEFKLE